jgi:hypothetical protein
VPVSFTKFPESSLKRPLPELSRGATIIDGLDGGQGAPVTRPERRPGSKTGRGGTMLSILLLAIWYEGGE